MFYTVLDFKEVQISATRCPVEMWFGPESRILNGQVIYIEKSKLNIVDMWLIPLGQKQAYSLRNLLGISLLIVLHFDNNSQGDIKVALYQKWLTKQIHFNKYCTCNTEIRTVRHHKNHTTWEPQCHSSTDPVRIVSHYKIWWFRFGTPDIFFRFFFHVKGVFSPFLPRPFPE